jgi:hypothetical protein
MFIRSFNTKVKPDSTAYIVYAIKSPTVEETQFMGKSLNDSASPSTQQILNISAGAAARQPTPAPAEEARPAGPEDAAARRSARKWSGRDSAET